MLVLTRKLGESIEIGDGVTLTVIEIKGHRVRLGIEAPLSVPILRSELARIDAQLPSERNPQGTFARNVVAHA
jgi:carbon storage regulator